MAQDVDGFKATAEEILSSNLSDGAKLAAMAELLGARGLDEIAKKLGRSPRTIERHYAEVRRTRKSADTQMCGVDTHKCVEKPAEVRTADPRICVVSRVDSNIINNTTQEEVIYNTPLPPKLKTKPSGPTPLEALRAFEAYNAKALQLGLPQAAKFTPDRKRKIIARLRDYGLDGWQRALENLDKSKFLTGQTDHGFRADLDFLCQSKSLGKLHDGGYGSDSVGRKPTASAYQPTPRRRELTDEERERIALEMNAL